MDVLIRACRSHLAWLALVAGVVVAACLVPSGRSEPSFPHRVHVVDNALACTFCHVGVLHEDDPGLPPPELCAPCHDRFDGDKPEGRRLAAFFGAEGRYRRVAVSGRSADVEFSHRRHATAKGLECASCHRDVADETEVPLEPMVRKSECMSCHAQHGQGNECRDCHRAIDRTWMPPSHDLHWERRHGDRVRTGSTASSDNCSLCHAEKESCAACHQQRAPRDHDATFRLRTHGLQASIDRSRCAVCHQQDGCQQCHEVTRPLSHRGGFGAPQDRHCTGCHFPLAETGCAVCHRSMPAHDEAAPLPQDHVPSMNCRGCHGNGVSLPHPDGGHVCTACHR